MVRFPILFLFLSLFIFALPATTSAQSSFTVPGTVEGSATTTLSIHDSDYLNITLSADTEFSGTISSMPEMIELDFVSSTQGTTTFTLKGLEPNTMYHRYINGYEDHATTTSDTSGNITFVLNLSEPTYIILQEHESTLFIRNDLTGGDCGSVGVWNLGTLTCTLTQNVTETIQIMNGGITLNGAGHTLAGPGSGNGIFIRFIAGVIIEDLTIEGFTNGIRYQGGGIHTNNNVTFEPMRRALLPSNGTNEIIVNTSTVRAPLYLSGVTGGEVTNSTFTGGGECALCLVDSNSTRVESNTFTPTIPLAISHINSTGSVFRNNTLTNTSIRFEGSDDADHNNDIDTTNTIDGRPILYLKNQNNTTIDRSNNPAIVFCINCNEVTITDVNPVPSYPGIYLYNNEGTRVSNSTLEGHSFGIWLNGGEDNTLVNNVFAGNQTALRTQAANTRIYNNTFQNPNTNIAFLNNGDTYSQPLPIGGNYWEAYNTPAEGCTDADNDNICDDPFEIPQTFLGVTDDFPWTIAEAWGVEPTCSISIDTGEKDFVIPGGEATLTWEAQNATVVSIDQGVGIVATSGSQSISPKKKTTYTLTAVGTAGTATCSATVDTLHSKAADLAVELANQPNADTPMGYELGNRGWDFFLKGYPSAEKILTGYQIKTGTTTGVDCSGLIFWAFNKNNAPNKFLDNFIGDLPAHDLSTLSNQSQAVQESELRAGDILYFDNDPDPQVDHVAMYVDDREGYDLVEAAREVLGIITGTKEFYKTNPTFGLLGYRRLHEYKPGGYVKVLSPVNLIVTDPDNNTLAYDDVSSSSLEFIRSIPGEMTYSEGPQGGDGNPEDLVYLHELKEGDYRIEVVPHTDALSTDTYSLIFVASGTTITLAQDEPISAIPEDGFTVRVTDTILEVIDEVTPEDLFAELRQTANNATIKPGFLKLRIMGNILAAKYWYERDRIRLSKLALKNLQKLIRRRTNSGITPSDAQTMTTIIQELLVLLKK